MFTIQPSNYFLNNVCGNVVFVDGFITERQLPVSDEEKLQLAELYPDRGGLVKRFKLESAVILTVLIEGVVRAVKFSVETSSFLACPLGIGQETAKLKVGLNNAVARTVDLLKRFSPRAVEPGIINCPGLQKSLESSASENFDILAGKQETRKEESADLLEQILEKVTSKA